MNTQETQVVILAAGCSRRLAHLTRQYPKSFLPVGDKRLIDYHLENLARLGFRNVCLVVGYRADLVQEKLGTEYGPLKLNYVVAHDYASTGHGWSWYLTRELWGKNKQPVLLVHADVFVDPTLLEKLVARSEDNLIAVDNHYKIITGDEILVQGKEGVICGLAKSGERDDHIVGELVGYSKFTPDFMERFYRYMEMFIEKNGPKFNYEPVLDSFVQETGYPLHYLLTDGIGWININYEEDLAHANQELLHKTHGQGAMPLFSERPLELWGQDRPPSSAEQVLHLNAAAREELRSIAEQLPKTVAELVKTQPSSAPQGALQVVAQEIQKRLQDGCGFVVVRGLEPELPETKKVQNFWALGNLLGQPMIQNSDRDKLYQVIDEGGHMRDGARYSRSCDSGSYHTDNPSNSEATHVLGLLCLRDAMSGGESRLINVLRVYQALIKKNPRALQRLQKPFYFDRRGHPGEEAMPVLSRPIFELGESFHFRYLRDYIEGAYKRLGETLDEAASTALDALDAELADPQFRIDFRLKPGDMLWNNNFFIAHGRTSFQDWPDPNKKRLMMRLWLKKV